MANARYNQQPTAKIQLCTFLFTDMEPRLTLDPALITNRNARLDYPEVTGYFSGHNGGPQKDDLSHLKYAFITEARKNVHLDLNDGIQFAKRKLYYRERKPLDTLIESLLWWIKEKKGRLDSTMADFVTNRGLLRQIMTTPYETEPWEILASAVNGVIYLCNYDSEEQFVKRQNLERETDKFMSWGFKFEQYVLSDTPGKAPDTSKPVDETEEFHCMFKSKLGDMKLMYTAEMDGVVSRTSLTGSDMIGTNVKFLEVKTSGLVQNDRQQHKFERYKLLSWWGQSYLAGVLGVICGFRDNEVKKIDFFPTSQIPRMAKNKWSPDTCMNFLEKFLIYVKDVISKQEKEDPGIVWKFTWKPGKPVTASREDNNKEFCFLPQQFIDIQRAQVHRPASVAVSGLASKDVFFFFDRPLPLKTVAVQPNSPTFYPF